MTPNLSPTELKRLHRSWRRKPTAALTLILEDVQGPFNVGSIVRTAAAERIDRMWLAGASVTPTHSKAQRTGMGCERLVPWEMVATIDDAVAAAKDADMTVVGIELADGAAPIFDVDLTSPVCLVVGHEDRGLSNRCLTLCDSVAYIPQLGRVGSLNVAQAAGMAIYEARRQQWTAGPPPTP